MDERAARLRYPDQPRLQRLGLDLGQRLERRWRVFTLRVGAVVVVVVDVDGRLLGGVERVVRLDLLEGVGHGGGEGVVGQRGEARSEGRRFLCPRTPSLPHLHPRAGPRGQANQGERVHVSIRDIHPVRPRLPRPMTPRDSHRWRQPRPSAGGSTSNDSIRSLPTQEADAPSSATIPPPDPDTSTSSTGTSFAPPFPRHPNPAVDRVLRLPDFATYAAPPVADVVTPEARTSASRDEWLMPGRRGTPGETTLDVVQAGAGGFRPFPLPPPPLPSAPGRRDLFGRSLGAADSSSASSVSADLSGMDFTMDSYTSPTQPSGASRAAAAAAAALNRVPAAPPELESLVREIAYWRRIPGTVPARAHVSPWDAPPPPSSGARTGAAMARARMNVVPPPGGSTTPGVARNAFVEPAESSHLDDVSPRERYRERTSDESMDVSRSRDVGLASSRMPRRGHTAAAADPRHDDGRETDDEAPERYRVHDISDSLISSSDATMDRGHASASAAAAEETASRSRTIEEEPAFEMSESREERTGRIGEEAEDGQGSDEDEDEDDQEGSDDDESHASSTRHLRDDELEMLILRKHLGFRGSFAPGIRIGMLDVSKTAEEEEEEEQEESGFESGSEMDADASRDAFGSRPARDPPRERKRKRTGSEPRRVVFDVEKRRRQWLSEAEDRALRRGPVMGLSLEEFKNGRLPGRTHWRTSQLISVSLDRQTCSNPRNGSNSSTTNSRRLPGDTFPSSALASCPTPASLRFPTRVPQRGAQPDRHINRGQHTPACSGRGMLPWPKWRQPMRPRLTGRQERNMVSGCFLSTRQICSRYRVSQEMGIENRRPSFIAAIRKKPPWDQRRTICEREAIDMAIWRVVLEDSMLKIRFVYETRIAHNVATQPWQYAYDPSMTHSSGLRGPPQLV